MSFSSLFDFKEMITTLFFLSIHLYLIYLLFYYDLSNMIDDKKIKEILAGSPSPSPARTCKELPIFS